MNVYGIYLAALHQQDLLEEAGMRRRARQAALANQGVPVWRRILAAGTNRLSGVLASAARTIDPSVDCVDAAAA